MEAANARVRRLSDTADETYHNTKRAKLTDFQVDPANMAESQEIYDLLILVDGTASMSGYLSSLNTSLPKIITISELTDAFSRIGLLAYRDYCDKNLIEWSGWMCPDESATGGSKISLVSAARRLSATGGGDYPEATKTGLAKAYELMRENATTIILLYTDAPPHTKSNGTQNGYDNWEKEQKALKKKGAYGGHGSLFMDWVEGAKTMAMMNGRKRAHVFSVLAPSMQRSDGNYYTYLSTLTGGASFYLKNSTPSDIAKVTVNILLAWMGAEKTGTGVTEIAAVLSRCKNPKEIKDVKKESNIDFEKECKAEELQINSEVLKHFMPRRETPVRDFAQRYKSDDSYRRLVVEHMQKIIDEDVSAISLNPVFGSLWRTVCNDRTNEHREKLISSFGLQVDRIANVDERERMKIWLAESYDYSAEVQEAIETVPEAQRFPCVYLDPTIVFTKATEGNEENDKDDDRPITEFRRDELLEIGRSCDYRILRRLGRVLTRLTFVNTAEELPSHIANAEEGTVIRIPMALGLKEFDRKFWKILLHIIVPGTMLSARPAALLAALTIRLGIQPLFKTADTEMMMWRGKWNDLEVPETWNVSCLSLLLDANKAYLNRKQNEEPDTVALKHKLFLKETDKKLFELLVSYSMLEMNLKTTLTAKIGWKPEKTAMPIGPLVVCRLCKYPRSVTIMGPKGKCGCCMATDYKSPQEREEYINNSVAKDDSEISKAMWVECSIRTCRAQYVVYSHQALNVRPKCHYCREQSSISEEKRNNDPAPWLECTQCLNRVIFPKEYRADRSASNYKCVACSTGRKTVVEIETTANDISKENNSAWLLENKNGKLKAPLGGRSVFYQISQAGTESFCDEVVLFPDSDKQKLVLNGKLIQNTPDLIEQLKSWVSRRRTELGTCSLCFSNMRKSDLNPACGRRSCEQRICRDCLGGWYGLNTAGHIINTAALNCPFCRRAPTAKTLHNYGTGIHAVGNLREAVENAGEWVYAWCMECSRAKRYIERVCAAGAPGELAGWVCGGCEQLYEEATQLEIARLEVEMMRLDGEDRRLNYERRTEIQRQIEAARAAGKKKKRDVKKCPQCEVMTEKSGGCGHLTCPCGTHWCWFCGEKSDAMNIYSHIEQQHGGIHDDGNDTDEEWDEEEVDYEWAD